MAARRQADDVSCRERGRIIDAATGELLRELDIDLTRDNRPRHRNAPR